MNNKKQPRNSSGWVTKHPIAKELDKKLTSHWDSNGSFDHIKGKPQMIYGEFEHLLGDIPTVFPRYKDDIRAYIRRKKDQIETNGKWNLLSMTHFPITNIICCYQQLYEREDKKEPPQPPPQPPPYLIPCMTKK